MPSTQEIVKLWRTRNGKPPSQHTYPEAASQVFKRGWPVYLVSGKVTACVAAGSNLDSTGNEIFGIAVNNASGTTDTDCEIILVDGQLEVCYPVTHATAASAVTAITQVGSTFQLENTTGKNMAVPIDDTSNPVFVVTEIAGQYAVGEQYGWVWGKYLASEQVVK